MTSKHAIVGWVNNPDRAEVIVDSLRSSGFSTKDISLLFPESHGRRDLALEKNTKAPEGAVAGVSAGGALGGTLGLLAGIGALAIPGVGPFIAAGPIMAALSGAAAGAAVGGVAGALVGLGIPEIEARHYEGLLRDGNILLSVHTEDGDKRGRARKILESNGARDVVTVGEKRVSFCN